MPHLNLSSFNFSCFPATDLVTRSTADERVTSSSQQPAGTIATNTAPLPKKHLRLGNYKLNLAIPGTENRKPVIEYIPLGGTISAEGTEHAYQAGKKSGKELLGSAHIPHNVKIVVEDKPPFTMDSKDLSPGDLLLLRKVVLQKLQTADSIVLTHGSDTMSLSAFFLHLTISHAQMRGKKIIFAGSMKPANFPRPDGPTNLSNALRLAKMSKLSGVMVVMNASGEVFAPPYFEKRHTDAVTAFQTVNGELAAYIKRLPMLNKHVVTIGNLAPAPTQRFDLGEHIEDLPYVPVIQSQASVEPEMIIEDIEHKIHHQHARAIVFAATGNGTIHEKIEVAISRIVAATGVPIIRATKVGNGEVSRNDTFHDDERGSICAGKLMPDMAALLAQVAIAHGQSGQGQDSKTGLLTSLRTVFDDYQTPKDAPTAAA